MSARWRFLSAALAALLLAAVMSRAAAAEPHDLEVTRAEFAHAFFLWEGVGDLAIEATEGRIRLPEDGKRVPVRELVSVSSALVRQCDPRAGTVTTRGLHGSALEADLAIFDESGATLAGSVPVHRHETIWMPKAGVDFDFACDFDEEPGSQLWLEVFDLVAEMPPVAADCIGFDEVRWYILRSGRGKKKPATVTGHARFAYDLDGDGNLETAAGASLSDYWLDAIRNGTVPFYGN
jgi:hypothetical protein